MNEYDYGDVATPRKTFASEEQKVFWEAFSQGAKDGEERTFFTGNINAISSFMSIERERQKNNTRER